MENNNEVMEWLHKVQSSMEKFQYDLDNLAGECFEYYSDEELATKYAWELQEADVAISHACEHVSKALNVIENIINEEADK